MSVIRTLNQRVRQSLGSDRQAGYTLLELIVAMAIFMVVLITATASFVSVTTSSNKAAAQRTVQQDVRYNLEDIARQTRASAIDYAFYKSPDVSTDARCSLDGHNMLALLYNEADPATNAPITRRLIFYWDTSSPQQPKIVKYVENDSTVIPSCSNVLSGTNGTVTNLTADPKVRVSNAKFFVSPTADPYDASAAADVKNTHPRVTVLITAETGQQNSGSVVTQSKVNSMTVQTTISMRAYPLSPAPDQAGQPVWSALGREYVSCIPPGPSTCLTGDPDGSSVYSFIGYRALFDTNNPRPASPAISSGIYSLTITYKNFSSGGLPVPPNYSFNVTFQVNGSPPRTINLPVDQPGTAPRTYTIAGLDLNGPSTFRFTWNNDSATATTDANFAIVKLELTQ